MTLARDDVADLAPLLRRAVPLDPSGLVRLRRGGDRISALVRLPFGVLAGRTLAVAAAGPAGAAAPPVDVTLRSAEVLEWVDGDRADPPGGRDAEWRSGLPPSGGWQRVDTVPGAEIRSLVKRGADALQDAAVREGVPGAEPRSAVADALLDSIVLTVTDGPTVVEVSLRTISAITRLGFLPADSYVAVDIAGRWVRVAAAYGSVYAERPGAGLGLTVLGR